MKTKIAFLLTALLSLSVSLAFAEGRGGGAGRPNAGGNRPAPATRDPGVNHRQNFQSGRTAEGVRSGQLTRDEAKGLGQEQKSIRQEERQMKSDGKLTGDERKELHQDLNGTSRDIYKEKHDGETRPGVTPTEPGKLGTRSPGIDAREANQKRRIGQGVRSGQLTPEETKSLLTEQKDIRQQEKEYKSDGNFTLEERKQLHQELNEASRDIYREKHDDEKMPWANNYKPSNANKIDYREISQWHHIFGGIRSGELTAPEASKLVHREELVARLEHRMKEDGSLNAEERRRLNRMLDELRRDIWAQKHDGQTR